MAKPSGPGKSYRTGITLMDAVQKFDSEEKSEAWFIEQRWPDGVACPFCGSIEVSARASRKPQPYRCRSCRKDFSVKTGTLLHSSNIPLSKWAIAFYLYATNLKGVSSMKLHRDLGITQKSAWHMAHRVREMWTTNDRKFAGPVEVDEVYIGGKEGNKHASKKLHAERGTVGKTPVVGVKDRATNQVHTEVVSSTDKATLQGFILRNTEDATIVFTDEHGSYVGIPRPHASVSHSAGEFVRGMASTNGLESHWALFRRGLDGVYHHVSVKHLARYNTEFEGRHNFRPLNTADQMTAMARGAEGKRLRYNDLVA